MYCLHTSTPGLRRKGCAQLKVLPGDAEQPGPWRLSIEQIGQGEQGRRVAQVRVNGAVASGSLNTAQTNAAPASPRVNKDHPLSPGKLRRKLGGELGSDNCAQPRAPPAGQGSHHARADRIVATQQVPVADDQPASGVPPPSPLAGDEGRGVRGTDHRTARSSSSP